MENKEIHWTPQPGDYNTIWDALALFKEMATELDLDGIDIDYIQLKTLMDWCSKQGEETPPTPEILEALKKYLVPAFSILEGGKDRDKLEPIVRQLMEIFPEMKNQWELYVEE